MDWLNSPGLWIGIAVTLALWCVILGTHIGEVRADAQKLREKVEHLHSDFRDLQERLELTEGDIELLKTDDEDEYEDADASPVFHLSPSQTREVKPQEIVDAGERTLTVKWESGSDGVEAALMTVLGRCLAVLPLSRNEDVEPEVWRALWRRVLLVSAHAVVIGYAAGPAAENEQVVAAQKVGELLEIPVHVVPVAARPKGEGV